MSMLPRENFLLAMSHREPRWVPVDMGKHIGSVHRLACGIVSLINAFDPEVVILGGGIAKCGAALFAPLDRFLERFEWRPTGTRAQIVPAQLGEWAGAFGAAYHALQVNGVISP